MPGLPTPPPRIGAPIQGNDGSGLMTLISAVVIVAALSIAREVLIPIALAVLLSFVLAPLVNLLRRAWLGRVPAVILAVLVALGVILGAAGEIGAQVAELAGDIPRYTSTIQKKILAVQEVTIGRMSALVQRASKQIDHSNPAPAAGGPADGGSVASASTTSGACANWSWGVAAVVAPVSPPTAGSWRSAHRRYRARPCRRRVS